MPARFVTMSQFLLVYVEKLLRTTRRWENSWFAVGTLSRRGVTKVPGWLGSHALGFLTALIRPQRIKHMHTNRTPTTEKETNRQVQRLEIL